MPPTTSKTIAGDAWGVATDVSGKISVKFPTPLKDTPPEYLYTRITLCNDFVGPPNIGAGRPVWASNIDATKTEFTATLHTDEGCTSAAIVNAKVDVFFLYRD